MVHLAKLQAYKSRGLLVLIVAGVILTSFLTAYVPTNIGIWVFYFPLLCLTYYLEAPRLPLPMSILTSTWLLFDLLFLEPRPIDPIILGRRTIGAVGLIFVAYIIKNAIISRIDLKNSQTKLKNQALELAKKTKNLERSNQELEQFASVAAHDLRAPIKSIFTWTEMLDNLTPKPRSEDWDRAISVVLSNAQRAEAIVSDVLEISSVSISLEKFRRLDLNRILNDIVFRLKSELECTGGKINVNRLPSIKCNETFISSVFNNLISNALKYREKSRSPEISVGYSNAGDFYEFYVQDNGIGIDSAYSERVFEMFKRLHNSSDYPGTGIGLAFCKKVIELCGGRIWVESELGKGSTFHFTYPKNIYPQEGIENHESRHINHR